MQDTLQNAPTLSRIHLIGGEKGGVGKSMVSRLLAQYFIDHDMAFVGFDTDRSHGALMRFYTDYAAPVVVDSYEALDHIVEEAMGQPGIRVLVDLAAQTHVPLVKWIEDSGVLSMAAEAGFTLTYWHVMDSGRDSVDLLARLLDRFGDRLNYVIVRNELRGDDFSMLEKSCQQARAQALGAGVMNLRQLHNTTAQKIDAVDSSFWAACNATAPDSPTLGMIERQRLKQWIQYAYEGFASVGA